MALLFNASVHTYGLYKSLLGLFFTISGIVPVSSALVNIICIMLNCYCIMLQRYNWIRINQVIKKVSPQYEKQKEVLKEKLKLEDDSLKEHQYKIINVRSRKVKNIVFDDFLAKATREELRECLNFFEELKQNNQPNEMDYFYERSKTILVNNRRVLKLELKKDL